MTTTVLTNTISTNSTLVIDASENNFKSDSHPEYLEFLFGIMLLNFIISYFFYYTERSYSKDEALSLHLRNSKELKYEIINQLSFVNFIRGVSIMIIILTKNNTGNNLVAFFNYIAHIFPYILFFTVFFKHLRFIIEKYYEMKSKKRDIFFRPTFQFLNIIVYSVTFFLAAGCYIGQFYYDFMIFGTAIVSLLSLLLGVLYFYFCVKVAEMFHTKEKEPNEIKERQFINSKITLIGTIVGLSFLARSVFTFMITINIFEQCYPTFIEVNVWDTFVFVFNEILCSMIIGYRRTNKKINYADKLTLDKFDHNKKYANSEEESQIKGDNNNPKEPLLAKVDKERRLV